MMSDNTSKSLSEKLEEKFTDNEIQEINKTLTLQDFLDGRNKINARIIQIISSDINALIEEEKATIKHMEFIMSCMNSILKQSQNMA